MSSNYSAHSLSVLLFALFVVVSFSELDSDSDKRALLSFKAESDRADSLLSWLNSLSSDPCSGSWIGVTCDAQTRRVTKLVLENLGLVGSVRVLSQLTDLRHLSLKNNSLTSVSPLNLTAWPNLKHVFLSNNRFAGNFPAGISGLRRIQRVDFSHNRFSGKIPLAELALLPRLLTLRLESNSFDGELDINLTRSSPVSDFNVSDNNLTGEIPDALRRFSATSFQGNEKLCGEPLPYNCTITMERNDGESGRSVFAWIVVSVAVTVLVAVTMAVAVLLLCRRENESDVARGRPKNGVRMVVLEGCNKGIGGVDELLRASAELLGKGSVGATYRVAIDGGDTVVVKRVLKVGRVGKETDWWLSEVLGNLRHDNVVSLRAYHRSPPDDGLLLLVYDHFPRGSLFQLLHGNRGPGRTPLDWPTRLKLASDSARGLAFVHSHDSKFKLCHGHLTSSNILVYPSGDACLADVGLPQLLRSVSPPNNAYMAPELTAQFGPRRFTPKCDVYSFGVVLLEILTGKTPDCICGVEREEWTWEALDVELLGNKGSEKEITVLIHVAMLCLAPLPRDRPAMSAVYQMIEDIRTKQGVKDHLRLAVDDLTKLAVYSSPPE